MAIRLATGRSSNRSPDRSPAASIALNTVSATSACPALLRWTRSLTKRRIRVALSGHDGRPDRCPPARRYGPARPSGRPRPAPPIAPHRSGRGVRGHDQHVGLAPRRPADPVHGVDAGPAELLAAHPGVPVVAAEEDRDQVRLGRRSSQRGISTRFCRSCVPPIAGLTIVTSDSYFVLQLRPGAGRPRRPRGWPSAACRSASRPSSRR